MSGVSADNSESADTFQARVIKAHVAADDSQLQLKVGDIVTVVDQEPGWWGGYRDGDDEHMGWFPSSKAKAVEESARGVSPLTTSMASPTTKRFSVASPQRRCSQPRGHSQEPASQPAPTTPAESTPTKKKARSSAHDARRDSLREEIRALESERRKSETSHMQQLKEERRLTLEASERLEEERAAFADLRQQVAEARAERERMQSEIAALRREKERQEADAMRKEERLESLRRECEQRQKRGPTSAMTSPGQDHLRREREQRAPMSARSPPSQDHLKGWREQRGPMSARTHDARVPQDHLRRPPAEARRSDPHKRICAAGFRAGEDVLPREATPRRHEGRAITPPPSTTPPPSARPVTPPASAHPRLPIAGAVIGHGRPMLRSPGRASSPPPPGIPQTLVVSSPRAPDRESETPRKGCVTEGIFQFEKPSPSNPSIVDTPPQGCVERARRRFEQGTPGRQATPTFAAGSPRPRTLAYGASTKSAPTLERRGSWRLIGDRRSSSGSQAPTQP